jgi:hypothetical protein
MTRLAWGALRRRDFGAMQSPQAEELSGYLSRPMTPPLPEVLEALAQGPIHPDQALARSKLDRLLDSEPLDAETGWCTLPDGVAYAAVRTEMPGVSPDMVDWWFDWHPRDPIRYRIWFPGAHSSISFEAAPSVEAKRHWGTTHHPVEDIGLGMDQLRIAFQRPTRLGFATDALDDPRVGTIICGLVGDDRRRMQHTLMVHVFLNAPNGLIQRSRFWIGSALRPYAPAPLLEPVGRLVNRRFFRSRILPERTARVMAEHCAAEYANLATLLPELFSLYAE